jgi:predicted transglutaminase-like cysteine proteinase
VSPLVKLASVVLTGAIALLRGPVFIFIDPVVISRAQTFEPAVSTALMALRRSSGVERTGLRSVLPPLRLVFREGTAMPCHQPILKARHTCHSVQLHRNTVHSVGPWRQAQYGDSDYWASPLQTLASRTGDCEDYAIVKYVALRAMGIDADDLRLVIVQDDKRRTEHAVVAVRYEQKWLILDNLTMAIITAEDVRGYHLLFALNSASAIAVAAVDPTNQK